MMIEINVLLLYYYYIYVLLFNFIYYVANFEIFWGI